MVWELRMSVDTTDCYHKTRLECLADAFTVFHDPFPSSSLVVKPLIVEDTYLLCPAPVLQDEGM